MTGVASSKRRDFVSVSIVAILDFICPICGKEISLFVISTNKSAGARKMEKVRAQTSRALEWLDYRLGTEYLRES